MGALRGTEIGVASYTQTHQTAFPVQRGSRVRVVEFDFAVRWVPAGSRASPPQSFPSRTRYSGTPSSSHSQRCPWPSPQPYPLKLRSCPSARSTPISARASSTRVRTPSYGAVVAL
eukprot:1564928-Rhodomonas_salina.1